MFDQYISLGSGARSVTHNIGFGDLIPCEATEAAYRVLKKTKAAAHSYKNFICTLMLGSCFTQNENEQLDTSVMRTQRTGREGMEAENFISGGKYNTRL